MRTLTEQPTCTSCKKKTRTVIETSAGKVCYSCYVKRANKEHTQRRYSEEAAIQSEFFAKIRLFFPTIPDKLLFAVPNGGSRNKLEAANLKRQGVKSGVADVILLMPGSGYASLLIEFKTKTGRQSPEQLEFQRQAEKAGNKYVVVRSVVDAIMAISEYLNIEL
jgi:hypothetical protein